MQLTRAAEYALRGMSHLARVDNGELCQISDLAKLEDVPETFMRKIVHILSRSGLIRSLRGKNGGITLRDDPKKITVLQVIEAVEGPIALNICMIGPDECDRQDTCAMCNVWAEAQSNLKNLKEKRLNTALDKVKEHPRMSEDVKAEAQTMVNNGVDPNTAVQMAVLRAENKHQGGILTQIKEKNPTVLEMLNPGNPKGGDKPEGKLPPSFEKACQRDIADGTFKDRADYIKHMDPGMKQSLGLE